MTRLALLLVVVATGCTTTVRQHPDFATRRAHMNGVAVMPPDVSFVRKTFTGDDEPMTEETAAVRRRLPELIAVQLGRRGFTVKPALLDDEDVGDDNDLRYQTTLVTGRFKAAGVRLQPFAGMKSKDAASWRLSIGPEVNRFADHAGVDGLVFAQMAGWKKSRGEIARDVALTILTFGQLVPYTEAAALQVALVDGNTGEILWSNAARIENRDFTGRALDGLVASAFGGFPP